MSQQDYLAHVDRDTYVQVCRALNRVTLGLPLDRPATDAEIAAMARRDRERGAAEIERGAYIVTDNGRAERVVYYAD